MKRMTMLLLMALTLPAGAEMYKWSSNGQVVFGDTPPKGVSYEPILLRGKLADAPPVVAKPQQSGLTDAEALAIGNSPTGNSATGATAVVSGGATAPVSAAEALAVKRKADEEAKARSRKQCNEATERTNQLLAIPFNKRPMDFDARVMASKKETSTLCY